MTVPEAPVADPGHPCPCGQVHELAADARAAYEAATAGMAPVVRVTTEDGSWLVPRIFIAVHGLSAADLPALAGRYGFEREG